MGFKSGIRSGLWWIAVLAVVIVLPFFFWGTSNGHDLTFHVNSWIEVAEQWAGGGAAYPHWAGLSNYGNGEPRFVFYPPISWTLGALLGLVLTWSAAPGMLSAMVCIAAGISMYLFAREWVSDHTAVLAAVVYAANPYLLLVIYERAAFGEMVSAIWFPGLLLFALRERGGWSKNTLLLALHVAALWLTNLPSAVLASYLLAGVVIVRAIQLRSVEPLTRAAAAMVFGLGLAGFYLVPAAYEQRWVQIGQAVSPGASPRDNFLFVHTGNPEHDAVLLRTSLLAAIEFGAVALFAWRGRSLWVGPKRLYNLLAGVAAAVMLLMLPISLPLWLYAPKLMFVQFPWRWMLVLNVVLALFVSVVFSPNRWSRLAVFALMPLLIGLCYWRFHQKIYPEDRPVALAAAIASGEGYEGTDEYTPIEADTSKLQPFLPRVAIQLERNDEKPTRVSPASLAHTTMFRWEPAHKRFAINSEAPTRNVIRLLEYPAWRVTVNGKPYPSKAEEPTGRMLLELPAGHHEIAIDYAWTQDRTWGTLISIAAFAGTIGLWIMGRR